MSHEVRTPLAVIQAAVSNLVQFSKNQMPPAQTSMVNEIEEATERLNRLVGEILQITRLECGHIKPKLGLHEVHDLFRVAQHETGKDLRNHKLTVDIAPGLPQARMDFELTLHAVTNLLSNAGRHTPENAEVRLGARVENEALLLSVADSSPGIPTEALPSLFDKFYRAPTAKPGGVGLGLSVVKGFVEAQDGKVTAANRLEGGAIFTIRLPLKNEAIGVLADHPADAAEVFTNRLADNTLNENALSFTRNAPVL